jgi:saccharopine dehydrogenase-like NADP-dependent oxidoreductase
MLRRIVLIGATGFFGHRLAEHLAAIDGIELVLTSRDEMRARSVAQAIGDTHPSARIDAMAFDRDDPLGFERLIKLSPWLVIDASGPFQSASYDLARAALDVGAHWIDLADARDYLVGFEAALDPIARREGLVARTGASSTPALSTAVVEDLTRHWQRLDSVDIAIMPGGAGRVGTAVIRAILSYAGTAIETYREGERVAVTGWGSVRRTCVPGLGVRYLSPVETADAALLPERFNVTSRVAFYAGLESPLEQFGLLLLAKLRQHGFIKSIEPLAPLLHSARRMTGLFASDRGAMTVNCAGLDADGRQISSRWCLLAESGSGPNVPVLPAVALTRALICDAVAPGAGIALLPLQAIEAEMPTPALKITRTAIKSGDPELFECGLRIKPRAERRNEAKRAEAARL